MFLINISVSLCELESIAFDVCSKKLQLLRRVNLSKTSVELPREIASFAQVMCLFINYLQERQPYTEGLR